MLLYGLNKFTISDFITLPVIMDQCPKPAVALEYAGPICFNNWKSYELQNGIPLMLDEICG